MKRRVLSLLLALVLLISVLPLPAMAVDTELKYYKVILSSTDDTHRDSHPVGTYHVMYNDYITLIVFPNGNASTVPTRQYWSYLSQWEAQCSNLYTGVTIADTGRLVLKFPMTQRVSFLRNPNLVSKGAKFNSSDKVTSGSWTVMTEQKLDMSYMKIQRNAWDEIEVQTYFENDGAQAILRYSIWRENEDDRSWSVSVSSNVDYKYHSWNTWSKNIKMDGTTMVKNPRMSPYKHNWKLIVDHLDFAKVGHSQQGAINLDEYWYNNSGEGSDGVTTMAWNSSTAINYYMNVSEGTLTGQWLDRAYTSSFPTDNQFVYLSPFLAYSPAKTYSANNFNGSSDWYGPVLTNAMELDISDGDHSFFGTLESWGFTDMYAVGEEEIPDSSEATWNADFSNMLLAVQTDSGVQIKLPSELSSSEYYNSKMLAIWGAVRERDTNYYEFLNGSATLGTSSGGVCLSWEEDGYLIISKTGQVLCKGITLSTPSFTFYSPINKAELNALSFSWSCPRYQMGEDGAGEWQVTSYNEFGLSIGMDHSRSDAEFYLDIPGSSTDLEVVSIVPDRTGVLTNVYFSGTMDLNSSLLSLTDLSVQEIQTGYQNGEYTVMGMKASGSVGISDIIGFPTAKASARINTVDDEVYGFSLEVKIPMMAEVESELELKRLNNGALAPNNLYLFAGGPVGIPLVPPVILAELNGAGGGFSNLADTINGDFYAIPPLKLTVTGGAEVLQLVSGKASATVGLGYYKLMLHDPEILGLLNLDAYYSETLYVQAQRRNYKDVLYTGLTLGGARYLEATLPGKKIADIIILKGQLGMDTFAGVNNEGKKLYLVVDANGSVKGTIQIPTKVGSTKLPSAIAGKKLTSTSVDMRMKAQTTVNYSGFKNAIKSALKNAALAASFHWEKEILEHTIAIDAVLNKHVKLSVGVLFDLTDISVTIPLPRLTASAASSYASFAATGETDAGEAYGLLVSSREAVNSQSSGVTAVPTPGAAEGTSYDVTIATADIAQNAQLQLMLDKGRYTAEELEALFTVTDEDGNPVELIFAEYDDAGNLLNESDSPNAYSVMPVEADADSYAIDENGNLIKGEDAATDAYGVVLRFPDAGTYTVTTNTAVITAAAAQTAADGEAVAEATEEITEETEAIEETTEVPSDAEASNAETVEETESIMETVDEAPAQTEAAEISEAVEAPTEETEVPAETDGFSIELLSASSDAALTAAEEETTEPAEEIPEETEPATVTAEDVVILPEARADAADAAAAPTFTVEAQVFQPQEGIDEGIANLKDNTSYVLDLYLVDEEGKAYDYQSLSGKDEVLLTSSHNGRAVTDFLTPESTMNVNYLPTGSYSVVYELAKRGALIGEDGKVVTDEDGSTVYVDIPVAQAETGAVVTNTNPDDMPEVSEITVADVGNEILRASWNSVSDVDGYYVSVQQLSGGIWTDTGAAYEVRDNDGDGQPDTSIDMAITITGVDDNLLLADQSYRVKVQTLRDLTIPGSNEVAARHSEGVISGSTTVKEITPVSLIYTPEAIVTTDDSGAVTGKMLYVMPGQDVILTASSAADITVSTDSANVTVDAAALSSTSATFTVPEFNGTLLVRVDAVDKADGDITTEYLSLRRDNIAPLIITDQQILRIAPGNTTVTITGRTEPGVTLSIHNREYPVNADGSFTAEVTFSENVMQTDGTISINGGAKPKLDENGEPLTDADGNILYEDDLITVADNPELATQILGETTALLVTATDRAGNMGTATVYVQWSVESGHVHSLSLRYNEDQHWTECSCGETGTKEDHIYEGIDCTVCGYDGQLITLESIAMTQDYLAMEVGESALLLAKVAPAELASRVRWSVEQGSEGILFVDSTGKVTALGPGLGYAIATVSDGTTTRTARCRVDVTTPIVVEGIQLGTTSVTSQLYSTDYAKVDLLLLQPQNYPALSTGLSASRNAAMASAAPQPTGSAIETAVFTDAATAALFDLVPADDGTLSIVPKDEAVNAPKTVKSSYTSPIQVTVKGQAFTSPTPLKLTVKKTMPKLKASADALNSFYSGDSSPINITGGTATSILPDPDKAAPPAWLTLSDGVLTLTADAPLKSVSGKVHLLVQTEEWRIPTALTLTVKNTYKAPGLKLSATSVTLNPDPLTSEGVALQLLPKNKKETLSGLNVKDLSAPAGYSIQDFDPATGTFLLKTEPGFQAGKIPLTVSFHGTQVTLTLNLTVKTTAVKLKASASSVTLNTLTGDSAAIRLTATPADYRITEPTFRLLDGNKEEKLNSGELSITHQDGTVYIATTTATPANAKYTLYISAGGSKEISVKITTVTTQPTLKLKTSGNLDLSFPEKQVTLTPTFKNHSGGNIRALDYTITETSGKTVLNDDVQAFSLTKEGGQLYISLRDTSQINVKNTYMLNFKLTLADYSILESSIKIPVKRTSVNLKLSASKLTLNKSILDQGSITVSCTTKDYSFIQPTWRLMDSKGKEIADEKLDVSWFQGTLTVSVNETTEYGATYKLLLSAEPGAPEKALTVAIPAEAKSAVTSSLKASGSLDVIRDGTALTLTPSYKNAANAAKKDQELLIYSSADNYTVPVNQLFNIRKDAQGRFLLTRAEGAALDHSLKYQAVLVTTFPNDVTVQSKAISLKPKMGSAKLTLQAADPQLFVNDRNDRVEFTITSKDAAQNGIARVSVKEAKYKDLFQVYDYGNGQFGVGFGTTQPDSKLKTVTLTLEVWLEGNETAKANGSVKLKLQLVR